MYTMQLQRGTLGGEFGTHEVMGFDGKPLIVVKGDPLGYSGYSLIVDESAAGTLWKTLVSGFGAIPMGTEAWNIARVASGRPSATELRNPREPATAFEAGLFHAVSLNKGCYIGQEALSKIYTQDAIRKELWGLRCTSPVEAGEEIFAASGGERVKIGTVTSCVDDTSKPVKHLALGYLRRSSRKAAGVLTWNNASVFVGATAQVPATVAAIPYVTRRLNKEDQPVAEEKSEEIRGGTESATEAMPNVLSENQQRIAAWLQAQRDSGAGD